MTLDDFIESRQQLLIDFRAFCVTNNGEHDRDEPDWEDDFALFVDEMDGPSILMAEINP